MKQEISITSDQASNKRRVENQVISATSIVTAFDLGKLGKIGAGWSARHNIHLHTFTLFRYI